MAKKVNKSIRCTVQQCVNNDVTQQYCVLDTVTIGTHEMNPTGDKCTDCISFQLRQ